MLNYLMKTYGDSDINTNTTGEKTIGSNAVGTASGNINRSNIRQNAPITRGLAGNHQSVGGNYLRETVHPTDTVLTAKPRRTVQRSRTTAATTTTDLMRSEEPRFFPQLPMNQTYDYSTVGCWNHTGLTLPKTHIPKPLEGGSQFAPRLSSRENVTSTTTSSKVEHSDFIEETTEGQLKLLDDRDECIVRGFSPSHHRPPPRILIPSAESTAASPSSLITSSSSSCSSSSTELDPVVKGRPAKKPTASEERLTYTDDRISPHSPRKMAVKPITPPRPIISPLQTVYPERVRYTRDLAPDRQSGSKTRCSSAAATRRNNQQPPPDSSNQPAPPASKPSHETINQYDNTRTAIHPKPDESVLRAICPSLPLRSFVARVAGSKSERRAQSEGRSLTAAPRASTTTMPPRALDEKPPGEFPSSLTYNARPAMSFTNSLSSINQSVAQQHLSAMRRFDQRPARDPISRFSPQPNSPTNDTQYRSSQPTTTGRVYRRGPQSTTGPSNNRMAQNSIFDVGIACRVQLSHANPQARSSSRRTITSLLASNTVSVWSVAGRFADHECLRVDSNEHHGS